MLSDLVQGFDGVVEEHDLQNFDCVLVLEKFIEQIDRVLIYLLQLSVLFDDQPLDHLHYLGRIQRYQLELFLSDELIFFLQIFRLLCRDSIYLSDAMPQIIVNVVVVDPLRKHWLAVLELSI